VSLLADEVTKFVETIGCGIDTDTSPTPSSYSVHPFMGTLAVSVSGGGADDPVLTDSDGKEMCNGSWQRVGGKFNCTMALDGSKPGLWTVRTKGPASATWMSEGYIDGAISNCTSAPVLSVFRDDKNPVDWEASKEWPALTGYLVDQAGQTLKEFSVLADKPSIDVDVSGAEGATRLEFTLNRDGEAAPSFKLVKRISCDLVESPVISSSSVSPTTSPVTTGATTTSVAAAQGADESGSSWVWILLLLGAAAAAFGGYKWYRSRLFPPGTTVLQESQDRPGTFVELDGEVSGKRRVSLLNSGGRFLNLEPYAKSADITLSRVGEEVRVQYPSTSVGEDGDEVIINEEMVPFGIALTVQGFVIRVDVPVGFDEDDEEI
jgi:hypothetical protein